MPAGCEGHYFFDVFFTVGVLRYAIMSLRVNGQVICTMWEDNQDVMDESNGGCSAVAFLSEGNYIICVF